MVSLFRRTLSHNVQEGFFLSFKELVSLSDPAKENMHWKMLENDNNDRSTNGKSAGDEEITHLLIIVTTALCGPPRGGDETL